ncbi:C-terminal binding protein [Pectinatus cerevisiiphilus]|uniref:D-3-phosphoglycerate dehydrogenase n=1 Tax=Pectinatus cerevisiiphilus TaxID=86956 RepID=A0A4R3KAW0_9FIRM|nr:C-terminal binding protein [Pectinatus cerevisiiphilus]TCS80125.1 D-3-phosphoglycerate dehydrogenase [Pectinatus cerevisiiphilus]
MMKAIITDCDHENINIETAIFNKAGIPFELKQCHTEDDIINECKNAQAFIVQYAPITKKVMEHLPELKMIVRYGVGVDNVDIPEATKRGIQVCNVPDYGMNEVADHALALMMAFTRKIVLMNDFTKNQKWDYVRSIPIHRASSQTVGVVGLGRIGKNFAIKAHALGYNIIGFDPYYKESKETAFIKALPLEEVIMQADIISLHIPADGNKNLFNKDVFKKMKKTAILLNVARGGIINEDDLYDALKSGEIGGAGIDCVANEPMNPGNKLFKLDNYIATPHMAWYSEESAQELNRKVAEEAVRFLKGEKVHYPINKL